MGLPDHRHVRRGHRAVPSPAFREDSPVAPVRPRSPLGVVAHAMRLVEHCSPPCCFEASCEPLALASTRDSKVANSVEEDWEKLRGRDSNSQPSGSIQRPTGTALF
jgi:hypothetical protein